MPGRPKSKRTRLLAAIHAGAKKRGIDDDDRRDMMEKLVGKRSTKKMTEHELQIVSANINGRSRGNASTNHKWQRKARALWISAGQLGVINDATERALNKFVRKQTNVAALSFVPADQANKVIEALKAMLARPREDGGGGVHWSTQENVSDQQCIAHALWRQLMELDVVIDDLSALNPYCRAMLNIKTVRPLTVSEWSKALPKLAAKLKKAKKENE